MDWALKTGAGGSIPLQPFVGAVWEVYSASLEILDHLPPRLRLGEYQSDGIVLEIISNKNTAYQPLPRSVFMLEKIRIKVKIWLGATVQMAHGAIGALLRWVRYRKGNNGPLPAWQSLISRNERFKIAVSKQPQRRHGDLLLLRRYSTRRSLFDKFAGLCYAVAVRFIHFYHSGLRKKAHRILPIVVGAERCGPLL